MSLNESFLSNKRHKRHNGAPSPFVIDLCSSSDDEDDENDENDENDKNDKNVGGANNANHQVAKKSPGRYSTADQYDIGDPFIDDKECFDDNDDREKIAPSLNYIEAMMWCKVLMYVCGGAMQALEMWNKIVQCHTEHLLLDEVVDLVNDRLRSTQKSVNTSERQLEVVLIAWAAMILLNRTTPRSALQRVSSMLATEEMQSTTPNALCIVVRILRNSLSGIVCENLHHMTLNNVSIEIGKLGMQFKEHMELKDKSKRVAQQNVVLIQMLKTVFPDCISGNSDRGRDDFFVMELLFVQQLKDLLECVTESLDADAVNRVLNTLFCELDVAEKASFYKIIEQLKVGKCSAILPSSKFDDDYDSEGTVTDIE